MLKEIIISNFKNFDIFRSRFERVNIIKGENGAGKTNLLEAIYVSLNGHTFTRTSKNIAKDPSKPATITSIATDNTIMVKIDNNSKTIKLNSKLSRVLDLKKKFPCVDYSINSFISFRSKDYLFSLLDRGIYTYREKILDYIMEYKKLQKVKRVLLKNKKNKDSTLILVNNKLKGITSEISQLRLDFVKKIDINTGNCFGNFYRSKLTMKYVIGPIDEKIFSKEVEKRKIMFSLKKDSLKLFIDNRDITYSSVGEKKIALLCIVLNIVKMYNDNGKQPIFLVDDLEGDLDSRTQDKAFEIIKNLPNQVFITTLGAYKGYNMILLYKES